MRNALFSQRWWIVAGLLLALDSTNLLVLAQQTESPAALAARVEQLIQRLDDEKFEVRERAEAELATMGEAGLAALNAATRDGSAERRLRASRIVKRIRQENIGLRFVSSVQREELLTANSAAVSPDGKFLYVPAWSMSTACVFRRDSETGAIEHVQSIMDRPNLYGLSALRVSPDGRLVAGACGSANTVVLFTKDAEKGTLTTAHIARSDPQTGLVLQQQSDVAFSPDSKFLYSLDRRGAVLIFRVAAPPRLEFVQTFEGENQCLANAVGIAMQPDGSEVYVVAANASALTVAKRDAMTGKLELNYVLRDEQEGIRGFSRVYGVCCSPDGRFVYTCAGGVGGDNAITAFERGKNGKLALIQEFINDKGDLKEFVRGSEIVVTPDGHSLIACAPESGTLACFDREPASGKLSYRGTIRNEGTTAPMGDGATGIGLSPDGKHLYVAVAHASAVSVFERLKRK
jgi:6-phosphogluconolactonase (cycloisomerase 2 family)